MRTGHFLYFSSSGVWGGDLVPVGCIWAPGGLGCCPFWGGGSVVVGFLFVVTPIVGVCGCYMFCCALLYVRSSVAVVLVGRGGGWLLCLVCLPGVVVVGRVVLAVPRGCLRFVVVVFPDHAHLLFLVQTRLSLSYSHTPSMDVDEVKAALNLH